MIQPMPEPEDNKLLEEINENLIEDESDINYHHLFALLAMLLLTEAGIEILFVIFPYFNNNVANNYFSETMVSLIVGISNILVFFIIITIKTMSSNTSITKLMIVFCSLSVVASLFMGNFFYVEMWQFTTGFLVLMISFNMVECLLIISLAECLDRNSNGKDKWNFFL